MPAKLTSRPLQVGAVSLPRYDFNGQSLLLLPDLVALLGTSLHDWRSILPLLAERRYSVRLAVEGRGAYARRLFTLEGAQLLCGMVVAALALDLFDLLVAEIKREFGSARRPGPAPARPAKREPNAAPVFTGALLLSPAWVCCGVVVQRYAFRGQVWLLVREVEAVVGTRLCRYRDRNPQLMTREHTAKVRIEGGGARPYRLFSLPAVQQLAWLVGTARAGELFSLVSDALAQPSGLTDGGA